MRNWDPLMALHLLTLVLAFQGATEKKKVEGDNPKADAEKQVADEQSKESASKDSASPDDAAIRKIVEQFEEAFNDHDAKAIGGMFAEHAEMVNADGDEVRGQAAIEQVFVNLFEEHPAIQVEVNVNSIRSLGGALMIEVGSTSLTYESDGPREISCYTVIYTKELDRWLMSYVRDSNEEESVEEHIQDLTWLIGDWVDESSEAVVLTTYRWTENQRAMEGEFQIHAPGYPALDGTHRIGWDPQAKQLRTWVFDSEGGFASGLWSQTDEGWMIKMSGVLRDGQSTSATNILQRQSGDHLSFRSTDRVIGGNALPDGDELIIVRRPPKPETVGARD
jgi:uncharacterized protein (TIGR02246 family)